MSSLLKGLFDALEGVGFMADISNWVKLRIMSRMMSGNKPATPAPAANSNQPLQAGSEGKGVFDEYLVLAALFDGVDMNQKVTKEVISTFEGIIEQLQKQGKPGAAKMLLSIIGIKESEITSRETEDADDANGQAPLAARRRGKKVRETTIRRNDRGTRLLLGFHSLGETHTERVCASVTLLNTLSILDNSIDKLAITKKGLHEKWDKAIEAMHKYFGENDIENAKIFARHIIGSDEDFKKMLADEKLKGIWERYHATDVMEEKLKIGEEFSKALLILVRTYFGETPEPKQPPELDFIAPLPKKKTGIWYWIECVALALIIIAMAGILLNN